MSGSPVVLEEQGGAQDELEACIDSHRRWTLCEHKLRDPNCVSDTAFLRQVISTGPQVIRTGGTRRDSEVEGAHDGEPQHPHDRLTFTVRGVTRSGA